MSIRRRDTSRGIRYDVRLRGPNSREVSRTFRTLGEARHARPADLGAWYVGTQPARPRALDERDPFEIDDDNRPHLLKHGPFDVDDLYDAWAFDAPLFYPAADGGAADWLRMAALPTG